MQKERIATIIIYRNHADIDVQFDDGFIVKHISYSRFCNRSIPHPDHKTVYWPLLNPRKSYVNRKKRTLYGYRALITVYEDNTVDYIDDNGTFISHGSYRDFVLSHI